MKNLSHLNRYFWKYRGRLFAGFILIALGNVFNVYAPVIVRDGIDFLADALAVRQSLSGPTSIPAPSSFEHAASWFQQDKPVVMVDAENYASTVIKMGLMLAGLYILMFLIKGIFLFYQRQALIVMSRHIEYDLKNEVYQKYQELDSSFYKRNRTGDLMNRISEDVNRVRMYVGPAVMYTINLIVLLVMCTVVMLQIDVELTLYTLSPLPFMMIAIYYVSKTINKKTELVQQQQSKLSAIVQESISGIRVLRAFNREQSFADTFESESNHYKEKQLQLVRIDALFMPVIVILVGLSTILTVYIGAQKVMAGELSAGVVVQFVFYVNILTWPFAVVGWVTSLVQKAEASQARINEFLRTSPEINNPATPAAYTSGAIRFEHVSYRYPDSGTQALHDINLEIPAGTTLGVIGRTGSGKSTLAQLLVRMIDPDSGSIKIGKNDLRSLEISALRNNVGYVPQEVFLFSDSIRNNITFGMNASEQQIAEAAAIADVQDTIVAFPDGYDTQLGERGINLSGGQKQRVSIARAVIKNPEILLFDDCLSAVDTHTEDRIIRELRRIMVGKSSIVIAHRISTVKDADHIIYLDQGRIIEQGTHSELLDMEGAYAQLYKKQLLEESQDEENTSSTNE
ncbi:MAG: ABC transporter ATP-binding protein [Flavobacteriales bacterium]|jgi:ATP-binding cassette subfamily B multidrug efflux pump